MPARSTDWFERCPADTFLLAAFAVQRLTQESEALEAPLRILDLGCGPGRVLYEVSLHHPQASYFGLDIQEEMIDRALTALKARSVQAKRVDYLNPTEKSGGAFSLARGCVKQIDHLCSPASFDVVFMNPPYYRPAHGKRSPDPLRACYRHEGDATVRDFLRAAEYALKPQGQVVIIYRATEWERFEAALQATRLRIGALQDVYSDKSRLEPTWKLATLTKALYCSGVEHLPPIDCADRLVETLLVGAFGE